jgi:hypothetical protein
LENFANFENDLDNSAPKNGLKLGEALKYVPVISKIIETNYRKFRKNFSLTLKNEYRDDVLRIVK